MKPWVISGVLLATFLTVGEPRLAWAQNHKPLSAEDWRILLLDSQPMLGGADDFFLLPRWFHPQDITSLKTFLDLPETQKALHQADQNYEAYMAKLNQATTQLARTRYSGLMTDFTKELSDSLDLFLLSHVRHRPSPISEREAEQIILPNLRRKYGRFFDLNDTNQKREFEREKTRLMLAHERPRNQNAVSEEEFYSWQEREYRRFQERRKQNVFRIYELILELFPGEVILGRVDANQTMDLFDPSIREMTRRDLLEGTLIDKQNYDHQADSGRGHANRGDVTWYLQMKDGTQYGMATRSQGGTLRFGTDGTNQVGSAFYYPTPQFTDDRYRYANMMSFERQVKLALLKIARSQDFKSVVALDGLFKGKWGVVKKMKFHPNLDVLRMQSEKAKEEVRKLQSSFEAVGGLDVSHRLRMTKSEAELRTKAGDNPILNQAKRLFWIGGYPSYWSERDGKAEHAKQIGTDISFEEKESKLGTSIYSDSLRLLGHEGGARGSHFDGRTNLKPENHQKNANTARTFFRIEKIEGNAPVEFYELADLTQVLGTQNYTPPSASSLKKHWVRTEIQQSTQVPTEAGVGLVNIPTPENHALANLTVTDADSGSELIQDKDYSIRKVRDRNAYFIQMTRPDQNKNINFSAGFTPLRKQAETPLPPLLAKLNFEDLQRVIRELRDGKLTVLAEGLRRLLEHRMMEEKDVSIFDVLEVFQSHSLYSFNPVPGQASTIEAALGPFAEYARFVNEQGVACIQCSGGNSLFRLFLKRLFFGNENVSIVNVSGFSGNATNELNGLNAHLITDILIRGFAVTRVDATPRLHDRNKPSFQMTKADEVELKKVAQPNEKFLHDLRSARKQFHSHIEALAILSTPNDWWVRTGRLSKLAVDYFSGEISLQEVRRLFGPYFPELSHDFANHSEFIKSLREVALREFTTLNRLQNQVVEQRSSPVQNGLLASTIESILTVIIRVDKDGTVQPILQTKASAPRSCRAVAAP